MRPKKISHVSSLLKFLEKHNNKNWFYRGEDCDFKDTRLTASLYRGHYHKNIIKQPVKILKNKSFLYKKYDNSYYRFNTWNTFINAARAFFQDVPTITKNEKRNFMALCQHHAIPTPLLDISTSPLVALYFAAQRAKYNKNGRIYLFNSDNFVPLNNKILSYNYLITCWKKQYYPLSLDSNSGIKFISQSIGEFTSSGTKAQNKYLYNVITHTLLELKLYIKDFKAFKIDRNFYKIIQRAHWNNYYDVRNYLQNSKYGFRSNKPSYLSKRYIQYLYEIYGISKDKFQNKRTFYTESITNMMSILCFLIYLEQGHSSGRYGNFIPKKLNFIVTCTTNWSRIRAQKSKFIIQLPFQLNYLLINNNDNIKSKKMVVDNDSPIIHRPKPSYILSVNNKKEILNELDQIGINEESLFIDKDHIANYIKTKYYI